VARVFSHKYGEHYDENFSLVANMISVHMTLALATFHDWNLSQLDVKDVFLYGEMDKEIYMEQPPGYDSNPNPNYACKYENALCRLKQGPQVQYGKISQYL